MTGDQQQGDPVAFVGLGAMGWPVATRLVETGQAVRGFDVNPDALTRFGSLGPLATVAASPRLATEGLAQVIVMVHNEAQVDDVLFGEQGIVGTLAPDGVVWLASTVSPAYARSVGARLAEHGLQFVDGPVSGGVARAAAGDLSVFVGSTPSAYAAVQSTMSRCASRVFSMGEAGAGSAMKLINQILTATNIALTAEALVLGERAGIAPSVLIDAVTHSAGTSRQFELRAPRMAAGDHQITATVRTFLKDLTIAVEAAADLGSTAPLAAATRDVFERAGQLGLLDESDTTLIRAYELNLDATSVADQPESDR